RRGTISEPFDVNELVRAAARLVSPVARSRSVQLTLVHSDVPFVHGDRVHIQQVLLNLLFNGMDAMEAMSPTMRGLTVTVESASEGVVRTPGRDRGNGIAPGMAERIFDSFYTTKADGMGLGLAIARTLVQAHGGTIAGRNNPGGGATFEFTLRTTRSTGPP